MKYIIPCYWLIMSMCWNTMCTGYTSIFSVTISLY